MIKLTDGYYVDKIREIKISGSVLELPGKQLFRFEVLVNGTCTRVFHNEEDLDFYVNTLIGDAK